MLSHHSTDDAIVGYSLIFWYFLFCSFILSYLNILRLFVVISRISVNKVTWQFHSKWMIIVQYMPFVFSLRRILGAFHRAVEELREKKMFLFQERYVLLSKSAIPEPSANNQFMGAVDALEWWGSWGSDIWPSQDEKESKDCLRSGEIAISQAVLRISLPVPFFLLLPLLDSTLKEVSDLCYQFVVQCSAQSCETALRCWRMPTRCWRMEIPLPPTEI